MVSIEFFDSLEAVKAVAAALSWTSSTSAMASTELNSVPKYASRGQLIVNLEVLCVTLFAYGLADS